MNPHNYIDCDVVGVKCPHSSHSEGVRVNLSISPETTSRTSKIQETVNYQSRPSLESLSRLKCLPLSLRPTLKTGVTSRGVRVSLYRKGRGRSTKRRKDRPSGSRGGVRLWVHPTNRYKEVNRQKKDNGSLMRFVVRPTTDKRKRSRTLETNKCSVEFSYARVRGLQTEDG